jgi:hypothetical protein
MTCPSPHRVEVPRGLESLGLTSTAAARSSCGGAMALVGLPANRGRRDQPSWRGVGGARAVSGPRRSASGGTSRAAGGGATKPTATLGGGAGTGAVPVRCREMHAEQYASS